VIAPHFVAAESARPTRGLHLAEAGPPAPFVGVVTDVAVDGAGGDEVVLAGLATADGDRVLATYDRTRATVTIECRIGGRTRRLRQRKVALPEGFRFAFVLCENQVTVLADHTGEWQPLLTERDKVATLVDLRRPATLAGFRYAWGTRTRRGAGGTTGSTTVTSARAGLFGMAGLRDPHLVQHADGSAYVEDGRAFLTATCAGLGFFHQAHWGVFAFDPSDPLPLEQVGQLYFERDGLLLGDHAGQVVRDGDRWIVATSSWGDFDFDGVHVRHTVTTDDVLHGVHVLRTEATPLPTTMSTWDPAMTRIDGRWHVAFVESPSQQPFDFHPALAVTDAPEWTDDLRLVGAATDLHQCEGPIITQVDGDWWLLASDGDGRNYPAYTLEMRRVGRVDAPYPTNIPHPQLLALEDGDHLMLTFDGTQYGESLLGYGGHGDVVLMRSRPAP
jgi:hypothetical protein